MSELLDKYRRLNLPGRLIAITVTIFLATQLYNLVLTLCCITGYRWQDFLALPANIHDFLLKPWTLVSYMFVHADLTQDVFHLVLNMICLYLVGNIYLRYHTGRQLLNLYLTGGLFAGVVFLVVFNVFPYFMLERHTQVVGASAAIFAVIVAEAVQHPNEPLSYQFLMHRFTVKMKWIPIAALLLSVLNISRANAGGNVCHVAGALWGCLCGLAARRGIDITSGMGRVADAIASLFKPRRRMKATPGGAYGGFDSRRQDWDFNRQKRAKEAQLDAILDKMRRGGYDALTEQEKRDLFTIGKK
jgi:membrane associated rhomboid family serine protease